MRLSRFRFKNHALAYAVSANVRSHAKGQGYNLVTLHKALGLTRRRTLRLWSGLFGGAFLTDLMHVHLLLGIEITELFNPRPRKASI
jgi:hypothetical protein